MQPMSSNDQGRFTSCSPFASIYMDSPTTAHEVGIEGSKRVWSHSAPSYSKSSLIAGYAKMFNAWHEQSATQVEVHPYTSRGFEAHTGNYGAWTGVTYMVLESRSRERRARTQRRSLVSGKE